MERYYTRKNRRSPFVQRASPFQDIVIRCVRYAFAQIPAKIGRVFFSKAVALPFLRFRMIRHGFWRSPIHWREIKIVGLVMLSRLISRLTHVKLIYLFPRVIRLASGLFLTANGSLTLSYTIAMVCESTL